MTQVVLSVPEEKMKIFLQLINDFGYIKVEEPEFTIPAWQKREVRKRMKSISAKPDLLVDSKEALRQIKSYRV
jgi:hypothetical protein